MTATNEPSPIAPPLAPAPAAPPPIPHAAVALEATPEARHASMPPPRDGATANPVFGVVAVLGGATMAIGSFLDVASASLGTGVYGVSVDQHFMDGDGPITLAIGIAIIVLGTLLVGRARSWWLGWVIAILGGVGALVAAIDSTDVHDAVERVKALGGDASVGPALWVCLLGGLVAIAGGTLAAMLRRSGGAPA